ncbi:unnamed protein product [Darwinula stevensoni]|uniref:Sodium-coupled monocarboxylate transporter 1 n=1 Tax=Darwinula stevensoni TaxID=69355 RepID=A0A7R8XMD0_9CRUS|nr:unnamed protein product [Darwinula stevensoni]CAG0895446.1 unnamed protein product [Darwinula stevensoni]
MGWILVSFLPVLPQYRFSARILRSSKHCHTRDREVTVGTIVLCEESAAFSPHGTYRMTDETTLPPAMELKTLSVIDYAVFAGSLLLTLLIGLYQAWKGRKDSAKELVVASKGLSLGPITLSLVATYMSAVLLLGTPAEIYANGTQWWITIIGFMIGIPLASLIFLPIFYRLKPTSIFQYFELRYNSKMVRTFASLLYVFQMTLYMGVALYAPVVAVTAMTTIPEWLAIGVAGAICTLYTAIGGLRAVVWTDVFQVSIMVAGMLIIVIYGTVLVGGIHEVWRINAEYQRVTFFNFSGDIFERHTFWWIVSNTAIGWMLVHGANQASVQRYCSLPTIGQARWALLLNVPGVVTLVCLACAAGVVIFANYADCDPLKAGIIQKKDEIIPYFVTDKLGHLTGLPGVFLACLFSGALSTLSSGLNSLAAVTWEDGVKQFHWGRQLDESKAVLLTKLLSALYGVIAIGLALLAGKLGGVLQVCVTVTSVIAAPLLVLFLSSGVVSGALVALMVASWIGFGSFIVGTPKPEPLPSSIRDCPSHFNLTEAVRGTELAVQAEGTTERSVYHISYLLYMHMGLISGMVVTIIMSLLTGCSKEEEIHEGLVLERCRKLFACRRLAGDASYHLEVTGTSMSRKDPSCTTICSELMPENSQSP